MSRRFFQFSELLGICDGLVDGTMVGLVLGCAHVVAIVLCVMSVRVPLWIARGRRRGSQKRLSLPISLSLRN